MGRTMSSEGSDSPSVTEEQILRAVEDAKSGDSRGLAATALALARQVQESQRLNAQLRDRVLSAGGAVPTVRGMDPMRLGEGRTVAAPPVPSRRVDSAEVSGLKREIAELEVSSKQSHYVYSSWESGLCLLHLYLRFS